MQGLMLRTQPPRMAKMRQTKHNRAGLPCVSGLYAVQYCISAANDAMVLPPTDAVTFALHARASDA